MARIIQIDWSQINLIPFDIDTNFGLNYLRLKGHVFFASVGLSVGSIALVNDASLRILLRLCVRGDL